MSILNNDNYTLRIKFLLLRDKGANKVFGRNYNDLSEAHKEKIDKLMSKKYPDLKYEKLTNLEKCSFLQRKIIIHSILYYELNTSILSDKQFDAMCKKLLKGIKYTPDYEWSDYYYVFYDFDGSTGFDLYYRLNDDDREYLTHLAKIFYEKYKNQNRKGKIKNDKNGSK